MTSSKRSVQTFILCLQIVMINSSSSSLKATSSWRLTHIQSSHWSTLCIQLRIPQETEVCRSVFLRVCFWDSSKKNDDNYWQRRTTARVGIDSEKEWRELISNSTAVSNTINLLMQRLFTEEEIISHSVSCKASNSKLSLSSNLIIQS